MSVVSHLLSFSISLLNISILFFFKRERIRTQRGKMTYPRPKVDTLLKLFLEPNSSDSNLRLFPFCQHCQDNHPISRQDVIIQEFKGKGFEVGENKQKNLSGKQLKSG